MHSPASTAPSPSLMAGACRKGSDFELLTTNSAASAVESPGGAAVGHAQVEDKLQMAVSELNWLRRAQHDICHKLDRYKIGSGSSSDVLIQPTIDHISSHLTLLKNEKANLTKELENLRTMNVVQKERLQNEIAQLQKKLDDAIRAKEEALTDQMNLQEKLDQQRAVLAIICNHVKTEISNLLKVEGLSELLAERFSALISRVDEANDPSSLPEALLNKLADVSAMGQQLLEVNKGLMENEYRVQELNKFLVAQRAREAELVDQIRILKESLEQEREKGLKAEASQMTLAQRVRDLEAELAATMKVKESETRSVRLLEHEVREARLEKDMLKAALETAVCKANQQLQEQLESLRAEKEKALADLAFEREHKSTSEVNVRKLRDEVERLSQTIAREREAHKVEVNDLTEKNVQALKEVELAKQDLEALVRFRSELEALTEEIDKLTRENTRLKTESGNEADSAIRQQLEQQTIELRAQIEIHTSTINRLTEQLESAEKAAAAVESQLHGELETARASLEAAREDAKAAHEAAKLELENTEKLSQQFEDKLLEANAEAQAALENHERLQASITELQSELQVLKDEVDRLKVFESTAVAVAASPSEHEDLETPEEPLDAELDQTDEITRLKAEVDAKESEARAATTVLETLRNELELSDVEDIFSNVEALKKKVQSLTDELEEMKSQQAAAPTGPSESELLLQQRYSALEIAKDSLARQIESYAAHCSDLEGQLTSAQDELDAAEAGRQRLTDELEELGQQIDALKTEKADLEQELERVNEEHVDCPLTIETLKNTILALERQKMELQENFDRTDSDLRKLQSENDPARYWIFEKKFLSYVEDAARESSTMATVNLAKKSTAEEIVANLRRACVYFAERSRGLAETETLLRGELQKALASVTNAENRLRDARAAFDDQLFQKDLLIDQTDTLLSQARAQLANEKQRCEELSSELENQRTRSLNELSRLGNVIETAKRAGQAAVQAPQAASTAAAASPTGSNTPNRAHRRSTPVVAATTTSAAAAAETTAELNDKRRSGLLGCWLNSLLGRDRVLGSYTTPAAALLSGVYMGIQLACLME